MAGKEKKGVITENDDDDNSVATAEEIVDIEVEAEKEKKEEAVEVEEKADDEPEAKADDERLSDTDEEDDDDHEVVERKKETAKERRARAKAAKERDKREIEQLRSQDQERRNEIQALRRQQIEMQVSFIDERLSDALVEVQNFENIHAAAIDANKGGDATKALAIRNKAEARANQLQQQKMQLEDQLKSTQGTNTGPLPRQGFLQQFQTRNAWYNGANKEDILIARAVDASVAADGFNVDTPAFWLELERRLAVRLPEHYGRPTEDDSDEEEPAQKVTPSKKRGPPVGGGSQSSVALRPGQIRLSPERVQAIKDAGKWDDLKLRAKAAKAYSDYDKVNKR